MHANEAARIRPPMDGTYANGGADDVTLAAAATSAAIDTAASGQGVSGFWVSISCGVAFNIRFSEDGTDAVESPADLGTFPAGLYSFEINAANRYFKITANAAGSFTYWRSSRT